MTFREGLLHIYKNRQTDGEITDPFYLHCRLSDLASSSYEDKKKVELFYAVDKRLCVFETLIKYGKNGEEELLNSYMVVSELLSEDSFKKLIQCAVWVMNPTAQIPVVVAKEKKAVAQKPSKITPVKVEKAEEDEKEETRTPLNSYSYSSVGDDVDIFIGCSAILLLASLLVGLFGLLVGIFQWNIPWVVWQWIIGIVGGGWLAFGLGLLIYLLHDSVICDYFISGFLCLGVVAVVNFVLLLCLRENYKVIFGCISAWAILGGGILSAICFDDVEDEWGWVYVVAVIILLIGMVASLIWL